MKWVRRLKANRPKTISQKLKERIVKEFSIDIPDNEMPRRLFHGHHQRSMGAWSWCIGGNLNWNPSYGSSYSMSEILKAKHLITFQEHGFEISFLPVSEIEYNEWKKENELNT